MVLVTAFVGRYIDECKKKKVNTKLTNKGCLSSLLIDMHLLSWAALALFSSCPV